MIACISIDPILTPISLELSTESQLRLATLESCLVHWGFWSYESGVNLNHPGPSTTSHQSCTRHFGMSMQKYLIDTNIVIGLEDYRTVEPASAALVTLAAKYHLDILVHEVSRDDIRRDKDEERKRVSLSKLEKFLTLKKVRDLSRDELEERYGPLRTDNDVVDATLLHAIEIGAADFLVTQDTALHHRAHRRSPDLGRRVLYVVDAVDLLKTSFEPVASPLRYVQEVSAHTIDPQEEIFDVVKRGKLTPYWG